MSTDYGMNVLRHVIRQVSGNLIQALQITIVPVIGSVLFAIFLFSLTAFTGPLFGALFGVGVVLVGFCWAAVGWHRYVLLEEYPKGIWPPWPQNALWSYLGKSLLLALVIALPLALLFGIAVVLADQSGGAGLITFLSYSLPFAVSWFFVRLGLILPAAAVGKSFGMGESWKITAPVSSQILVPIVVIALAFTILLLATQALGGTLPAVAVIASLVVTWLQLLVNLSLMTTLYGTLVEARPLH